MQEIFDPQGISAKYSAQFQKNFLSPKMAAILNFVIFDKNGQNLKVCTLICGLEFSPPTSEAAGSNLRPGASCWKVGSYLPMPGGLQCSMHWFPPPVKLPVTI